MPFSPVAIPTGSGRSGSTGTRRAISAPCTVSSETSRRSRRCSTRSVGRAARAPHVRRSSNAPRSSRTASRTGRPKSASAWRTRGRDPVCSGATGRRGSSASTASYLDEELLLAGAELTWRAGAHRDAKGSSICHGTAGQRLRAPEGVRADGRRALARASPQLRRARAFADASAASRARPRSLLAVHG